MKIKARAAGVIAASMIAGTSAAADQAAISNENTLIFSGDNAANILQLTQEPNTGSRLVVTVTGSGNGAAPQGDWHRPFRTDGTFGTPALASGTITQSGMFQTAELEVQGTSNLFAVQQSGAQNTLNAVITGQSNQAMVAQAGYGSTVGFRQVGTGNSLSIQQNSW